MSGPATGVGFRQLSFELRVGAVLAALVLAATVLVHFGLGTRGLIAAGLCAALVLFTAIDLEQGRIPNTLFVPVLSLLLISQLALFPSDALEWIAAAAGAGLLLYLPRLFRSEAIGLGDVKLGTLLGAGLGGQVLPALLWASLGAAAAAAWILITRGADARGATIPLAPFLALGGILAVFLGDLPG